MTETQGNTRGRLRREWGLVVLAAAALAVGGALGVRRLAGAAAALPWVVVAGAGLVSVLARLGVELGREADVQSLGAATTITVARGLLYAAAGGFLLVPPTGPIVRWAPGLCYGAGALLDVADGRVAKATDTESALGERLDMAYDAFGMLVAPLVGVAWGRLPAVYLLLSIAPYAFRGGLAWRRRAGRPVAPLPASPWRRRLAAGQMAVVTLALLPVLPAPVVRPLATLALVPSLAMFARDWLAVTAGAPPHEG